MVQAMEAKVEIMAVLMENRTKDSFSLIHWNCNSIFNKQLEFLNFLNLFKPDIVSLNETKLSGDRFEGEPLLRNLTDYFMIHKVRHKEQNDAG